MFGLGFGSVDKTEISRFVAKVRVPDTRGKLVETLQGLLNAHFSLEYHQTLCGPKNRKENLSIKDSTCRRIYSVDTDDQYSLHLDSLRKQPPVCELVCKYAL